MNLQQSNVVSRLRALVAVSRAPLGVMLAMALASPAQAQSIDLNPVTTMLQSIVDALTGPLGLVVGTLAIAGVGMAWLFGFVNFATAAWTLVGVVLVAAAPTVAATFFA